MTTLKHILVITLIYSLAIPAHAGSKNALTNSSNALLISTSPSRKEKKQRDPNSLIHWAKVKRVRIERLGGKDGDGTDTSAESQYSTSDLGSGSTGGSSKGGGSASNNMAGAGKILFDESANSSTPKVNAGPKDSDSGGKTPPKSPPGGPKEVGKELTFWIPICFFFDPVHPPEEMNKIVKTVVDNYGKCDVLVRPYAFTVRPGTYDKDEPESMNRYAETKCNANQAFGVEGSAAQTHPNSIEASDRMCKQDWKAERDGYNTGGCSVLGNKGQGGIDKSIMGKMGNGYASAGGGGKPATSIVDRDSPDASTHELGHSTGGPGQGGNFLVNEGDGVPPDKAPKAGEFLQLIAPVGGSASLANRQKRFASGRTDELGGGFNDAGCKSIRGGANPNINKLKWYPNQEKYYLSSPEQSWLNFSDGKPIWGEKTPPGNPQSPPPIVQRPPVDIVEPRATARGQKTDPPGQANIPKSGPLEAQHPKNGGLAGNAQAQAQANQILSNSPITTPPSAPPPPQVRQPADISEPVVPLPPGASGLTKSGGFSGIVFNENGVGGTSGGSSPSGSGGGSFNPNVGADSNGSQYVGSSIGFNENGATGTATVSTGGESTVSIGRTSRPPVVLTSKPEDRMVSSTVGRKPPAKKKREFGDGLRKGSKVPKGELYQSGGDVEFDSPSISTE